MPVDRNYPKVDGQLTLTRLRVAEVKTAQEKAHQPVRPTPQPSLDPPRPTPPVVHTRATPPAEVKPQPPAVKPSKLPDVKPQPPAPRRASNPNETNCTHKPAAHEAKLPDVKPEATAARPTLPTGSGIDPQGAAQRGASLPTTTPRVTEPAMTRSSPEVNAPAPDAHTAIDMTREDAPAYDASRIVWRGGLATR